MTVWAGDMCNQGAPDIHLFAPALQVKDVQDSLSRRQYVPCFA